MPTPEATANRAPADIRRWRRYLADEKAEAAVYRDLASRRDGEDREILLALADAEKRHEQHWIDLLGDDAGRPARASVRSRLIGMLARRFGGVFILALAQSAEARSAYPTDAHATAAMAADEQIHQEVVRGLATRGRNRLAGTFRAVVFGMNDGLVSNLALVLGIGAAGADRNIVLLTGLAGLLAGAFSMGAGEYISIRSQRELLEASSPAPESAEALPDLDIDANELALVYRSRGMAADDADTQARAVLTRIGGAGAPSVADLHADARSETASGIQDDHELESHGSPWGAALSSFCFFALGAIIPVLPYMFGMYGLPAVVLASALVGVALLITGAITGLLSGTSPVTRALRQIAIGFSAAALTYLLGLLFGEHVA